MSTSRIVHKVGTLYFIDAITDREIQCVVRCGQPAILSQALTLVFMAETGYRSTELALPHFSTEMFSCVLPPCSRIPATYPQAGLRRDSVSVDE